MARDPDRKKKRRDEDDDREEKPVNVEEELQELEGAWDEAEDKGDSFGDIPDDRYQAKVTGARIGKSKSSNRIQIAWEFTIISGEYKNRKKWAYDGLETKENLDYVKTRLARLKVKIPKKISDGGLAEALEACIGLTCEIQVKTRGDFQNVYVNKLIDVDSDDVQDADDWKPSKRSRDDDDDDKPKKSRDDDDDEPKKKSRDDDDDDDRKERSKRRDDDDDDAPRKRSRDDDDDDDKPRKRRDDDDDDRPRKSKF